MKISIIELTPELARELLAKNNKNRRLSSNIVVKYTNEIKKGNWTLTGEPVQVLKNGNLGNGQHRCEAVIKANKSIPIVLMEDIEDNALNFMDTGKVRNKRDVVSINFSTAKNVTTLAAVVSNILLFKIGVFGSANTSHVPTNNDVSEYISNNMEIMDFVNKYFNIWVTSDQILTGSILITMLWVMEKSNLSSKVDDIIGYSIGLNLSEGHPMQALRTKVNRIKNLKTDVAFTRQESIYVYAYCIEKSLKGEKLTKIHVPKNTPMLLENFKILD